MSAKVCKHLLVLACQALVLLPPISLPVFAQSVQFTSTPNYWGDARMAGGYNAYGTYSQPYTGYGLPGNGTPLNGRALPATFGLNYNKPRNGYGAAGNPAGMLMGATILGTGMLAAGASRLATLGRGGIGARSAYGDAQSNPQNYSKNQAAADERRRKQEEKIKGELQKAHEDNLKRQGLTANSGGASPSGQNPSDLQSRPQFSPQSGLGQPDNQVSERGMASEKLNADSAGDLIPGDTAKALSF